MILRCCGTFDKETCEIGDIVKRLTKNTSCSPEILDAWENRLNGLYAETNQIKCDHAYSVRVPTRHDGGACLANFSLPEIARLRLCQSHPWDLARDSEACRTCMHHMRLMRLRTVE